MPEPTRTPRPTGPVTGRRARIADTAISTLAGAGMRGFTHRAVDRAAGLPEGSTSYYFRTRHALLVAVLDRLTELENADVAGVVSTGPVTLEGLTEAATALVLHRVTRTGERTLARYELTLEATRRPALREVLVEHGARIRGMVEQILTALGVAEPGRRAGALVAALDGVIFDLLAGAGAGQPRRDDIRATCHELLRGALDHR